MTTTMTKSIDTDEAMIATIPAASAAQSAAGPRQGRAKRRTFTSEYKRRIVAEYDAAPGGTKCAVLRRERLYDFHVKEWRAAIEAATLDDPPRRGRPGKCVEQTRIVQLEKQVARLEAEAIRKDEVIADRDAALQVLGQGVAFSEAIASQKAR